jgi:hypothetical protein
MDVTPVALTLFAFLGLLGTMLHFAINERRSWLEDQRALARANPNFGWAAVASALRFSKDYLDFIFGPYTISLRAFGIILGISLLTTFFVLGAMTRTMIQGMSPSVAGWAFLLALVDMLGLVVTRKIINVATNRNWHAGWTVALTLSLITVVAYFTMGLAWCVYYSTVQIAKGHAPDAGFVVLAFFIWLPSLLWTHNADIIPAAVPGAVDTLFLLAVIAVPSLFASTAPISTPLYARALDALLALPRGAGKALGYAGAVLSFLSLALKR